MKQENKTVLSEWEMVLLEKKIQRTDLKFEILKNAGKCIPQGKYIIFDFIKRNECRYSIRLMTETLNMDRREYHRWKKKPFNDTQQKKKLMQHEISSIFYAAKQRYGSDRIAVELEKRGYKLSSRTVRKYMAELGLTAFKN